MPGYLIAVPGTNTIYATSQASVHDNDNTDLHDNRYSYQKKGMKNGDKYWTHNGGRWPSSRGMGFYCDPASPGSLVFGNDESSALSGDWEPFSCGRLGNGSTKFIMGVCRDASSVPVSGAIVQGFLTNTDTYVGQTTADSNGRYMLGTPNPSPAQHYLVAYRDGSPDIAGTTVDTLVATNADGT